MKIHPPLKNTSDNKDYHINILLTLVASIVFTIFVLSAILYINFEKITLTNIYNSEKNSLSKASYSAKVMTETLKLSASQLYFDSETSKLSMFQPSDMDYSEYGRAALTLNRVRLTTPYVESIYVYNHSANIFIVAPGSLEHNEYDFFDKDIASMMSNPSSVKMLVPIPRSIPNVNYPTTFSNGYSFLFYENPNSTQQLYRAIILNISEEWLQDIIKNMDPSTQFDTFIVDKKGKMITKSAKYPMLSDISYNMYIRKILNSKSSSGYFTDNIDGEKSLVIYVNYAPLEWVYIRTIPYSDIMQQLNDMKNKTVSFGLLILALGLAISFFISQKLYKPIGKALSNLVNLEEQRRSNLTILKQSFLKNLLLGEFDTTQEVLSLRFKDFNIALNTQSKYLLLYMQIDCFYSFCSNNNLSDRNLLKFAILNIASECCTHHYPNEPVDMGEDHVVLLISLSDSSLSERSKIIDDISTQIQEYNEKYLDISLSIVISSVCNSLCDVENLYNDVRNAANYRMFCGHKCIIHTDSILKQKSRDYTYLAQREKALTEALITTNIPKINELFDIIMKDISNISYNSFHPALVHLAFEVNVAILAIENNYNIMSSYNFTSFLADLNRLETMDQINIHFKSVFENISMLVIEKKSSKHEELVPKVIKIIEEKYSDSNLSIDSIARTINISPAYLGRLFKKLSSKSVVDYINEYRITKAEELLASSLNQINDIVFQTGYTNNQYFYKMFKKVNGITPNEFRKKKESEQ